MLVYRVNMRGVAANCGFVVRLGRVYSGFMES